MVRYVTRKGKEAFHLKEEKKVDHQIVSLVSERSAKRLDKRRNDYIRKKEEGIEEKFHQWRAHNYRHVHVVIDSLRCT
jgi:hypothetical protein